MQANKSAAKTYTLTKIALMAAVTCVLGPLAIPIGPVPVSLTPLAVFLSVYIIGTKQGTISCLVYLLIGAVGVPVFSGFTGGFGKLAGPTGGYLIGFILMALISGWFIHRFYNKIAVQFLGMVLGLVVCYAFGTVWLAYSAGMTFQAALAAGVLPFIVFDLIKIVVSIFLGRTVRGRLARNGIV